MIESTVEATRVHDTLLARDIARQAGDVLLDLRRHPPGDDPRALGRAGDQESDRLILRLLHQARPHDAVLSEESADDPSRLHSDRVWIVDPLDGTREYGLGMRDDWAVHVALWQRGHGITAAAVAAPAQNVVATTLPGGNGPGTGARSGPLRILVSASRPPREAQEVARRLRARLVPMGSAGAKTLAVLAGTADAYLHAGGQWEWDSAAPAGVARSAGLHASRIDGSPLQYNRPHPYLPDVLICRTGVAESILHTLRSILRP